MKIARVSVIALVVVLVMALTSCGALATLADTHWRVQALGTGTGYHFITDTTGDYEVGILNAWGDVGLGGFNYTYDAAAKTGTIDGVGDFTIEGTKLTLLGIEYTRDTSP